MIKLHAFQSAAAGTIADRYQAFIGDPDRPRRKGYGPLPFLQILTAMTGAGKTPILADAVDKLRRATPIEPVVLWLSKGVVPVTQSLTAFQPGGKYHHLLPEFNAVALGDCDPADVLADGPPLLLAGTVATFNSKEKGDRRIFGVRQDLGGRPLWDVLAERSAPKGRRPLIVIYDEAHNFTDQQVTLLMELRPDALVLASATPKLPSLLEELRQHITASGFGDELVTPIKSSDVVLHELVKREVQLDGYLSLPEEALEAAVKRHRRLTLLAKKQKLPLSPKAIYVCGTNLPGDEQKAFLSRAAPPIRIWRFLVEKCAIEPHEIAVYCDLRVAKSHPLPDSFVLFGGGDSDYSKFTQGGYKHIIFNLSLQEGWDDPECYLAYIDKEMGSPQQVEQIVGRVLRQPGTRYYPEEELNTCAFFVHLDSQGVFKNILDRVRARLSQEVPGIRVTGTVAPASDRVVAEPRFVYQLPVVCVDMSDCVQPVQGVLDDLPDYLGNPDAVSGGQYATGNAVVGGKTKSGVLDWQSTGRGMPVSVSWLIEKQIERQYPLASSVCQLEAPRFKRPVELGSKASIYARTVAENAVVAFLTNARNLAYPEVGAAIPSVTYLKSDAEPFDNSVHERYSGLNPWEVHCARAIDALGWHWYRNPSGSGFSLHLFRLGADRRFFPDFILWTPDVTWLVDPKGKHLLTDAAARKLVDVESLPGAPSIGICLIASGKWETRNGAYERVSDDGVTSLHKRSGNPVIHAHFTDVDELARAVFGQKAINVSSASASESGA